MSEPLMALPPPAPQPHHNNAWTNRGKQVQREHHASYKHPAPRHDPHPAGSFQFSSKRTPVGYRRRASAHAAHTSNVHTSTSRADSVCDSHLHPSSAETWCHAACTCCCTGTPTSQAICASQSQYSTVQHTTASQPRRELPRRTCCRSFGSCSAVASQSARHHVVHARVHANKPRARNYCSGRRRTRMLPIALSVTTHSSHL